jgi:hypothetical protein
MGGSSSSQSGTDGTTKRMAVNSRSWNLIAYDVRVKLVARLDTSAASTTVGGLKNADVFQSAKMVMISALLEKEVIVTCDDYLLGQQ